MSYIYIKASDVRSITYKKFKQFHIFGKVGC